MDVFDAAEEVLPEEEKRGQRGQTSLNNGEEQNNFQRAISAWRGVYRIRPAVDSKSLTAVTLGPYRH
jgi:hypothetical protein